MDWVQSHLVEIFAIIGAVYTVARLVVALTPTPRDDEALERVSVFLKALAKVVGLDLKQGVQKTGTGGGSTTAGILLLLSTSFIAGCWANNPRANLLASQKLFSASVDSLTASVQAGKFSGDEITQIDTIIHQGQGILEKWEVALRANEDASTWEHLFDAVVGQLAEYQEKAKEKQ